MPTSSIALTSIKRLALTPGEPAGIGPDILLQLAQQETLQDIIAIASPELLQQRAAALGIDITLHLTTNIDPEKTSISNGELFVHPIALAKESCAGQLDTVNAPYVLQTLDQAIQGCRTGDYAGIVTGPVQKSIINDAGISFSGHTEYLAEAVNAELPVMLLANQRARVALVTTPSTSACRYRSHHPRASGEDHSYSPCRFHQAICYQNTAFDHTGTQSTCR